MQSHMQRAASTERERDLRIGQTVTEWWWCFKPTNGQCIQIDVCEVHSAAARMWYNLKDEASFDQMRQTLRDATDGEGIIEITNVSS